MKALARSKAAKRGRPRKQNVMRTESDRISRADGADIGLLETATWKRRQVDPELSTLVACLQEHGSVIHAWRLASMRAQKGAPDHAHGHLFTAQHLDTAERLHEMYRAYMIALGTRSPRSSTDFGGAGGHDNADPFQADKASRDARTIDMYRKARTAILKSGPFGMMAVETVIYENKDAQKLRGDLRLALNAVDRLWSMRRAA